MIHYFVGEMCSGKTTVINSFKKEYLNNQKVKTIIVSDIVKGIIKKTDRSSLQNTNHLDQQIFKNLLLNIKKASKVDHIIIDGIRQLKILTQLIDSFTNKVPQFMYYVYTPQSIRRSRFECQIINNCLKNDGISFDEAEENEKTLGIKEVIDFVENLLNNRLYDGTEESKRINLMSLSNETKLYRKEI